MNLTKQKRRYRVPRVNSLVRKLDQDIEIVTT